MPSRTLEIVLNGKNNLGPVVDNATKDLKRIKDSAELATKALSFSIVVGGVKGVFSGLTSAVELFKGNTDKAVEALYRLPFGVGEAVHSIADFGKAISGAAEREEELKKQTDAAKAAQSAFADAMKQSESAVSRLTPKLVESAQATKEAVAALNELDERFFKAAGTIGDLVSEQTIEQIDRLAEQMGAEEEAISATYDAARKQRRLQEEKSRNELFVIADEFNQKQLQRVTDAENELADRREEIRLSRARELAAEEDSIAKQAFQDWVSDLRDRRQLSGLRAGTVNAAGPTSRLQGFAADAESRRAQEQAELLKIQREHNEKLDNLIRVNERSGGQLERIFGLVGNL